jgi:N-methylhydantoinase B
MRVNPILLQVFKNRFSAISEEMGVTLNRTAFSPNIKERRDFSCALFNKSGDMIAQAAHIPVHLGSMPMSVKAVIAETDMKSGDMVMLNDPYKGGTHLPDITIVAPVFCGCDSPQFYVANRAHHADVGGISSGSMPLSTSLFQEGVIIPPTFIVRDGEIDRNIMNFVLNNVRTPVEREGDFTAQIMANMVGVKRLGELVNTYGLDKVSFYSGSLIDYSAKVMKACIAEIPNGVYEFEDCLDGDGVDRKNVFIRLRMTVDYEAVTLDFTESDEQVTGSVNAVYAITLSAVIYVFRCLVQENIPTNAGCSVPLVVKCRKGTVVDAKFPAAVAGGNVETSQRVVDVVLGALAKAIPDKISAASQGTMNNVTIGGVDERTGQPFAYYETLAGGSGAYNGGNGESAIHSHMTNTLNTPVEALEFSYPFLVHTYSVRNGSGGIGDFVGGEGLVREVELLSDAEVTVLSERRTKGAYGLNGGCDGRVGVNKIIKKQTTIDMGGKFSKKLKKGDRLRIETPGGGGYGG